MLKGLDEDILRIVQEIVRTKKNSKNTVILVEDIKVFLSPSKALEQDTPAEQNSSVILDPTANVATGEGVEGYASLFRSRFEKTMKILSQRPDSKRISKISAVKQNSRNGSRGQSERGERSLNGGSTTIVSGLLKSNCSKKNGIELGVDDYTR